MSKSKKRRETSDRASPLVPCKSFEPLVLKDLPVDKRQYDSEGFKRKK